MATPSGERRGCGVFDVGSLVPVCSALLLGAAGFVVIATVVIPAIRGMIQHRR